MLQVLEGSEDDAYDPGKEFFIPFHMLDNSGRRDAQEEKTPKRLSTAPEASMGLSGPPTSVGDLLVLIHTGTDPSMTSFSLIFETS